jgi:hypothetical protein
MISRLWPGATVAIAASGPSLTAAQLDQIRGRAKLIVINSTFRLAPWADALYACDCRWWTENPDSLTFAGLKFSLLRNVDRSVVSFQAGQVEGLEKDRSKLATGGNSGHQALNLAVHLGATRIALLGYDMRLGPNGETHHHPDHVAPSRNPPAVNLARWAKRFSTMVPALRELGVQVINATPGSAIECFPRARIEEIEWH